jgi:hypothetical protein
MEEGWCEKSHPIVMRAWELSTINIGYFESQYACVKGKFEWVWLEIFTCIFGTTWECGMLELEGNHSGHVWQHFGAINS